MQMQRPDTKSEWFDQFENDVNHMLGPGDNLKSDANAEVT